MCIILRDLTFKSTVALSTNIETWLHDIEATNARAKKRPGAALDESLARPERLLECLLLWTSQMQVQKPRWLTICCLRPFLVGYSHEPELSNATSYCCTSFATLLPKKCSISLYPFYWHTWCYRPTHTVQTHHFMYRLQWWNTFVSELRNWCHIHCIRLALY